MKGDLMKRVKRILALLGALLLFALYAATLIFVLIGSARSMDFLKAAIACTILVPVLLYAYMLFYRLSHSSQMEDTDSSGSEND